MLLPWGSEHEMVIYLHYNTLASCLSYFTSFCMCLSACFCTTCVPLDELAHVHTCVWKQEVNIKCLHQSLFLFLRWFFADLWAHCQLHWHADELQGSICLCNPRAGVTDICLVFFKDGGEVKLRSPPLHGKHLTNQAISLAWLFIILRHDYYVLWDSSYLRPP